MGFLEDALQSLGLGGFQFAAAKLGFVLQRLPAARKGLSLVLMLIRGEAAALSLELARLVLQRLTLAGYFPLRLLAQFLDRKSVVVGKSVSVRVDLGGRRIF